MIGIQDLPVESLENIFLLGSEEPPSLDGDGISWTVPTSKRLKHPFIKRVAEVCAAWYDLTRRKPNHHYYYTCVDIILSAREVARSAEISYTEYRRGLRQSNGSNIFIRWEFHDLFGVYDDFTKRMLLHSMHLLIDYQGQLRVVDVVMPTDKVLFAYLLWLQHYLSETRHLTWQFRNVMAKYWQTISSSEQFPAYPYPDLYALSHNLLPPLEVGFEFHLDLTCLHGGTSLTSCVTSLAVHHGNISVDELGLLLADCDNVSHLVLYSFLVESEGQSPISEGQSPISEGQSLISADALLKTGSLSLKSVGFRNTSYHGADTCLSQFQLQKLWLIQFGIHTHTKDDGTYSFLLR
jgi:hypothetical protein